MPHSLWDILPTEIQEIIVDNSFQLCREEYLEYNKKRHEKKQEKTGPWYVNRRHTSFRDG